MSCFTPTAIDITLISYAYIETCAQINRLRFCRLRCFTAIVPVVIYKLSALTLQVLLLLPAATIVAQGKAQTALSGIETGIVQRPFQSPAILSQQIESFGLVDGQMGHGAAITPDFKADINAPQFRRIKAHAELLPAGPGLQGNVNGDIVKGNLWQGLVARY